MLFLPHNTSNSRRKSFINQESNLLSNVRWLHRKFVQSFYHNIYQIQKKNMFVYLPLISLTILTYQIWNYFQGNTKHFWLTWDFLIVLVWISIRLQIRFFILVKSVQYTPSMMFQGKTPWDDPWGSFQLLRVFSWWKCLKYLERPLRGWKVSQGSFTETSVYRVWTLFWQKSTFLNKSRLT